MSQQPRVKSSQGQRMVQQPQVSGGAPRPESRGAVSARQKQQEGSRQRERTDTGQGSLHQRKVIGQYMLGKTIGEGTFGKVKLAIHLPTGEKVAVKILEKSKIKEQADVRRVNREIKILKKAKHGNIIQLYEVLDTPNTIYLMMENCGGGEMFDYIVAHRHVPEVQACKFFHQIIDGVEVLHKNDITHRDLKPENLLLKDSPEGWLIKIVDFGLSNTHEGGKLLGTACGSPCYAAPEMIAGKQYVGPSADMWSMGVILFALVCGFLPFEDQNTTALYRKILAGEYKPAKWISNEVKDLIRRVLEVDPRRRYTIADIRKHPWYTMVPESSIPKDTLPANENEQMRQETLRIMADAGVDIQTVMDGIASHACNSITAMYFLLEQKQKNVLLKQKERDAKSLGAAAGGNNKTQQASTESPRPAPSPLPLPAEAAVTANNMNGDVTKQQQALPIMNNGQRQQQQQQQQRQQHYQQQLQQQLQQQQQQAVKNPYAQTPPMLINLQQQQQQQQHHHHYQQQQMQLQNSNNGANAGINNAMPSLDAYLGTSAGGGNNYPQEQQQPLQQQHANSNVRGGQGIGKPPLQPVVPKLNLFASADGGGVGGPIMVSQTARPNSRGGNAGGRSNNMNFDGAAGGGGALSARAALPTDNAPFPFAMDSLSFSATPAVPMPADLLGPMPDVDSERPSTRRSRLRSRGEGESRPLETTEGAGGLDVADVTASNHRSVQSGGGGGDVGQSLVAAPAEVDGGEVAGGGSGGGTGVDTSGSTPAQPDAQKASSRPGGRAGKNLIITSSSNATAAEIAQLNKEKAQGQLGPMATHLS